MAWLDLVWLGFGWLFLGFGLIWYDFGMIWFDFGWIWFDFGWIWVDLAWILEFPLLLLGFYVDFIRILLGCMASRGLPGGPMRSQEVIGGPRTSWKLD